MTSRDIRRQLGGMPTGHYSMRDAEMTVVKPEPEKPKLKYSVYMGIVFIDDGTGPRPATPEEIEILTGGLSCWPEREDGGL